MRIRLLKIVYLMMLAAVLLRLSYWQIVKADDLQAMAESQHVVSLDIDAPRGEIRSSDGGILASDKPTFLLYAMPKTLEDKLGLINQLAPQLYEHELDLQTESPDSTESAKPKDERIREIREDLSDKLSQNLYWVALARQMDFENKKKIEGLKLDGIGFENMSKRYYPESSASAHILGFVGSNALGEQTGYFGIEGYYNKQLKGVAGVLTEERDARGQPILSGKFVEREAKSGSTLELNIDRAVQRVVEQKLKKGIEKYQAKSASAVVMDPKTGAVVAMATYPNYDPNSFYQFPKEYYKNSIVADAYEPGSTFKVLVMAAGINEDLIKPDTKCDICSEPVESSGYQIRTWNNKYYPDSTMTDVIVHSDNTGMVFVSRKLGLDKMYQYIQKFGFGRITQIDLQDEVTPDIRNKKDWYDIDLATASFGQGIAVTPIQMVRAISVIANGGNLMEPHVVKSIQTDDKKTTINPKIVGQPISPEAAKQVTQMMVEAVEKGEAKAFVPKGYKIAGKTGTAQIPVAGHYDPEKTIASFVGFAPADDPKFVMLVKYTEPKSSIFGSETAAPTFFEIAKELLTYYSIPPTQ